MTGPADRERPGVGWAVADLLARSRAMDDLAASAPVQGEGARVVRYQARLLEDIAEEWRDMLGGA